MGKYMKKPEERPYKIHPIWNGIGVILVVLVPVISWIAAEELVNYGWSHGWAFLSPLSGSLSLPGFLYSIPIISSIAYGLVSIPMFPAKMLFFVLLLIAFSGILSFLYAVMYRVIGPPRYTAIDAPPLTEKMGKRPQNRRR